MKNSFYGLMGAAALSLICTPVLAFKAGSHVWIAEKVIEDLQDGKVDIEINGKARSYTVNPQTVDAILSNKETYRMGNIGPDAAPGIYAGQMVIHPGTTEFGSDQWAMALSNYVTNLSEQVTDESWYKQQKDICESQDYNLDDVWDLIDNISSSSSSESSSSSSGSDSSTSSGFSTGTYLSIADELGILDEAAKIIIGEENIANLVIPDNIDPEQLAYAKGFYGHLAGDTFAHSYVNHYAEDIFSITNGEMETEKRHSAVEAYIDKKLPPLSRGAHEMIDSPSEFLADAFIFNAKIAENFKSKVADDGSLASGAPHLYAAHKLRKAVRNAASSCAWTAMNRFAGQIATVYWLDYLPSEIQVKAVNKIEDELHEGIGDIKREVNDAVINLSKVIGGAEREYFKSINVLMDSIGEGRDKLNSIEQDIINFEGKLVDEIVGTVCGYEEKIKKSCKWWNPGCQLFEFIDGPACETNSLYQETVRLRDKAIAERDRQFTDIRQNIKKLEETLASIRETGEAVADLLSKIHSLDKETNVFQGILKDWDRDIKAAMTAWVEANAQVIKNSIEESAGVSSKKDLDCYKVLNGISNCFADGPTGPITDWMDRWGAVLLGVPSEVTALTTAGNESLSKISSITTGKARESLLSFSDPLSRMLVLFLEKEISKEFSGKDKIELMLDIAGNADLLESYKSINTIFAPGLDKKTINTIFSQDLANLQLKTYTDEPFTNTLDRDMGLAAGSSDYMDWKKFPVVRNAVMLTKLTLLDASVLNQVAADVGLSDLDGFRLRNNSNILDYAVRNIDGHEAWKPVSDYSAIVSKSESIDVDLEKFACSTDSKMFYPPLVYGYSSERDGDGHGLFLWDEDPTSGRFFNQIFNMPLYKSNLAPSFCPRAKTSCGEHRGKVQFRNVCGNSESESRTAANTCGACKVVSKNKNNGCMDFICGTEDILRTPGLWKPTQATDLTQGDDFLRETTPVPSQPLREVKNITQEECGWGYQSSNWSQTSSSNGRALGTCRYNR